MPGFGRRYSPDEIDRAFLMRRKLEAVADVKLPTRKSWRINGTSLNQDETGTCGGQSGRNFLRCEPTRTEKTGPSAWDIYRLAVTLDPFADNDDERDLPDGDPGLDSGTTVKAVMDALVKLGRLATPLYAFSLQTALEWVLTKGPVVLGTNWPSSFMRPDAEGIVKITPMSTIIGGHAYLWRGADTNRALALCVNSWGDGWGRSGEFLVPLRDMERLIHDDGEAATAIEQRLEPKRVLPPREGAFDTPPPDSVAPEAPAAE